MYSEDMNIDYLIYQNKYPYSNEGEGNKNNYLILQLFKLHT